MASHLHETMLEMFRHRPELAAELLAGLGRTSLPAWNDARLGATEVTELRPTEHRADAVVVLRDGAAPVFAVVVEVQLRRDVAKRWVWPEYLIGVRRRLRCPTALLVVCTDPEVAAWADTPIQLDAGASSVHPQVLGPDLIPVLTDPRHAAHTPELVVLSALAHVHDHGPYAVLDTLVAALDHVEVGQAVEYAHLVLAALPDLAREHLEELMATETYDYQSEFTRRLEARGEARGRADGEARGRADGEARGRADGEARGRAAIVLRILDRRGIDVPVEIRDRITGSTDLDQLDAWADRALSATEATDLLD